MKIIVFILILCLLMCGCQRSPNINESQPLAETTTYASDVEEILVEGKTLSINTINNQIRNVFNNESYYSVPYFGNEAIKNYPYLIVGQTLEYSLYYSAKDIVFLGKPIIYIVVTNMEHPRSTEEEPLLYYFGLEVTEFGVASEFILEGFVGKDEHIAKEFIGSYSMCIEQISTPIHDEPSSEWKMRAQNAIQLYMDNNDYYATAEHNLKAGNYKVFIKGFAKSDRESRVYFVHEDGSVYIARYYYVHSISEGQPANLNNLSLIQFSEAEDYQLGLNRIYENAALRFEYSVDSKDMCSTD